MTRWAANDAPILEATEAQKARFWSKVDRRSDDECWEWLGGRDPGPHDYGFQAIGTPLRKRASHRIAYILTNGALGNDVMLDPLCRNCSCVNPKHLDPCDNRENQLRGHGVIARNARKTHCSRGHLLAGSNIMWEIRPRGERVRHCRACRQKQNKQRIASYRQTPRTVLSDLVLRGLVARGASWMSIARAFGLSDVAVIKRARKIGIYEARRPRKKHGIV